MKTTKKVLLVRCTDRECRRLTLGIPAVVRLYRTVSYASTRTLGVRGTYLLEDLHCVWTTAAQLAIPKHQALWSNVPVDETGDSGTKGLLLIRADPDQEPVGGLQASREGSADAGSGADADTSVVQRRRVGNTCELSTYQRRGPYSGLAQTNLQLAGPKSLGRVVDEAAREVSLDTADQVVVLRVCSLADDAEPGV